MRYNRKDIISLVSDDTGYEEGSVAEIYNSIEKTVYDLLLSANEHKDIEIRLFNGFGMYSKLIPRHSKQMPDGVKIIEPALRFSAKYTTRWKKENNRIYREALYMWERIKGRDKK